MGARAHGTDARAHGSLVVVVVRGLSVNVTCGPILKSHVWTDTIGLPRHWDSKDCQDCLDTGTARTLRADDAKRDGHDVADHRHAH